MNDKGKCPVVHRHTAAGVQSNKDWWPDQLNLKILHQHCSKSDPMGGEFNYAKEFKKLDAQEQDSAMEQIIAEIFPDIPPINEDTIRGTAPFTSTILARR